MSTDYTDLIAQLRNARIQAQSMLDAADAIEALQAECDQLTETQRKFGVMMHEVMEERDQARDQLHTCHPDCSQAGCVNRRLREELAAAQEDAARYRWIRGNVKEELVRPEYINSELPDLRTQWAFPFLYCSGPVGGYQSLDAAIDAAMTQEKRDE